MKFAWYLVALIAGAVLPIQAGLNTKLGKAIESPFYASMFSFITGALAVGIYIVLTKQTMQVAGLKLAPGYVWIAGALGAFFVTAMVLTFPRIGPAMTFGLVVAGQMLVSILMDHYKIMVEIRQSITIYKMIGVILIVSGVLIIRKC